MKPRRLLHRGTVQASAFWIDETIVGTATTRRRILEMPGIEEVRRSEKNLFVKLRAPVWISCDAAPGIPLVVCQGLLTAMPLDPDELETLGAPSLSVVLSRAGEAFVAAPDSFVLEDLTRWIDLSDWNAVPVKPLGDILSAPLRVPTVKEVDTRKEAGIAPLSSEAESVREALANAGKAAPVPGSSGFASGLLTSLSVFLSTMAAKLGRKPPATATSQSRGLVARPADAAPSSVWSDRLRMALNTAAARLLIWARLASWVGRRQAEYLAKTFDMFDSGDLDEALRHAIPLGQGSDKPTPIALGVPSPRADLTIQASRGGATSTMGFGGDVFEALRTRYRQAVEKLEKQGRIKEAAFVLAELLGASEEAVSFLEKHGQYRLAAELAEGRKLDPALIVRQWILAGDRERAILIARQTGCFATAIARLEPSHPEHAAALRVLWANQLAEAGAYAAAVKTIWPVVEARSLARDWIDRGIEIGGVGGLMLLAAKANLMPEAFDSVVKLVRSLPQDDSAESFEQWHTLGEAVLSHGPQPTMRILARMCVRALLPAAHERDAKSLVDRLAKAADDKVLSADLRGFSEPKPRAKKVRIRVAARTDTGLQRTVNEDGYLVALVENGRVTPFAHDLAERPLPADGALFVIADGLGGRDASAIVNLVFNTVTQYIQSAAPNLDAIGSILVAAVEAANAAVYKKATESDRSYAGCGATITATWLVGDVLWAAQVGDTRAYVYRDHQLVQITQDHSLVRELLESGQALPEDLKDFPHKNIITRAIGTMETAKVDLWRVSLCSNDRILLCTDGVHGMLEEPQLTKILSVNTPRAACDLLKTKVYEAGAHDNLAMIVVDVLGNASQFADTGEVKPERVQVEPQGKPAQEKRVITRSAADVGSMPVCDAAVALNGRVLVALGEAGVRLLSREGKTVVQFNQPADQLVMSDYGDRALALARRGDAYRIARIDLVGKRARHWMDVALQTFAKNFDGSTWFVADIGTVYAIDALEDSFQAIWQVSEEDAEPLAITRSAETACLHLGSEIWTIALPSFRVRQRRPVDDLKTPEVISQCLSCDGVTAAWRPDEAQLFQPAIRNSQDGKWSRFGDGSLAPLHKLGVTIQHTGPFAAFSAPTDDGRAVDVFDLRTKTSRLRVNLDGATWVSMRFQGNKLVLADDRGRVLLIHIERAEVLAEWRI